jgi:hypothetical protein
MIEGSEAWVRMEEQRRRNYLRRGRYLLREGSPGGERVLMSAREPVKPLDLRDELRAHYGPAKIGRRVFDVIDTDATDPPESGAVGRCVGCGEPVLESQEVCADCARIGVEL